MFSFCLFEETPLTFTFIYGNLGNLLRSFKTMKSLAPQVHLAQANDSEWSAFLLDFSSLFLNLRKIYESFAESECASRY